MAETRKQCRHPIKVTMFIITNNNNNNDNYKKNTATITTNNCKEISATITYNYRYLVLV